MMVAHLATATCILTIQLMEGVQAMVYPSHTILRSFSYVQRIMVEQLISC